ncbi:MAG TPA: cupin domain-containing protein [Candidatus Nanoarchaeia archaeon]|nr:cupin domain-containing protein [Candidatus Nanoarchaeia archaeon]
MSRLLKPNFEHKDERGLLREVARSQNWRQLNQYERKKGSIVGNHYHKSFEEFFFIIKGSAMVKILIRDTSKTEEFTVKSGDAFIITPGEVHAMKFLEDTTFITLLSHDFDMGNPDIHPQKILEG